MPDYRYRAINQNSRAIRGTIFAVNERDLHAVLLSAKLDLVEYSEVTERRLGKLFQSGHKARDLIQLAIHLEQLQRAGVSLIESVEEVRDASDIPRLRDVMSEVHRDVSAGGALSSAFARHPKIFSPVFQSLTAAGEETGKMADAFAEVVANLKWNEEMAVKVKKATRYPALLGIFVLGVVMFMMSFVVPQIVSLLESTGNELPFMTVALIATSSIIASYWYVVPMVIVGAILLISTGRRVSESFRYRTDYLLLRLPILGNVIRKISLARFSHMFAAMFGSGIDLLDCLDSSKRLVTNLALAEALAMVHEGVQSGLGLSTAMRSSGEFPPLVLRMVKVGEDSGNMAQSLENVAEMYNRDVDEAVLGLIAFIEPALTVIMGGLMAWIAIAVFGPVYDSLSNLG